MILEEKGPHQAPFLFVYGIIEIWKLDIIQII